MAVYSFDGFMRWDNVNGGEFLFVDAPKQVGEALVVEDVLAPCVGVGEWRDRLCAGDVAPLQNLRYAFVSGLIDEVEYVWFAWCGSRILYWRQGVYRCSFEAIEAEVPLERDLGVVGEGDGGSVVESGEDAVIVESPNGERGHDGVW